MQTYRTLQRRTRQRGAFGILAASAMALALGCLVLVVDGGRLYMEQRRLQKIADTAALESVARLPQGSCSMDPALALQIARESAQRNSFLQDARQDLQANCVTVRSMNGLRVAVPRAGQEEAASVEVSATHTVPASIILRTASLFSSDVREDVTLTARATAERETPGAAFAVGSQLLRLDNSKLLGVLLETVGLDPETLTLLDRNGLADASITPSGLLNALGVRVGIERLRALSPEGLINLVNTEVGLLGIDKLLAVSAELVSDSVLRAQLEVLRQEILSNSIIGKIKLNLFASEEGPGLLSISSAPSGTVGSALDTRINLEQILTASLMIGVASEGRALNLDGLDLLGIITVRLGIVEPPSIGIGPIGTTAYNAQVRLLVDVDTNRNSRSLLGVGSLLELLGTRIKLPIIVDLVDAKGTLTAVNCSVAPPTATIEVESRIGSACIGRMPEDTLWSTRQSCTDVVQDERLIRLLGINLLYGKVALPVLSRFDEVTLSPPPSDNNIASTGVNNLQIGTLVSDLLDRLLELLASSPTLQQKQFDEEQATKIADEILSSPDLLPTGTNGTYTNGDLDRIRKRLEDLGLDWSRPALLLLSTTMPLQWRVNAGALCGTNSCVRDQLIKSLQTADSDGLLTGLLSALLGGLLGGLQPLLAAVLAPLVQLLEPILNAVGSLLTTLLADVLGLELGRTDVELYSVGCGTPKLVR